MENKQQPKQMQVQIMDTAKNPIYANAMQITHTKDEFVLNFLKIFAPTATLNVRIITSPGHVKRIIVALQENVKRYESTFGEIKISDAPSEAIGFSDNK